MAHEPLSRETVEAVARLARLAIDPAEMADLRMRLGAVLAHAERLGDLDLGAIKPLTHVDDTSNRFGADTVGAMLDPETSLALAPDRYEGFYRVPKVLGDGGGA